MDLLALLAALLVGLALVADWFFGLDGRHAVALVGAALAIFGVETPMSSVVQQVVLLGVLFAALGVLLGAVVYLVADWRHEHPTLR